MASPSPWIRGSRLRCFAQEKRLVEAISVMDLMCKKRGKNPICLVLAPTRELAGYVEKEFREALSLGVAVALNRRLSNRLDRSTAGANTCQWNAVSEICRFSKRSTYNRSLIVEARAIPVLGILSINNKELIMFTGAVTSIIQVLRAGTTEARENAAVALFTLTLAGVNKIINGSVILA
ncbi:hypothetical protein Bca4012_084427 [Brassica carinata]